MKFMCLQVVADNLQLGNKFGIVHVKPMFYVAHWKNFFYYLADTKMSRDNFQYYPHLIFISFFVPKQFIPKAMIWSTCASVSEVENEGHKVSQ